MGFLDLKMSGGDLLDPLIDRLGAPFAGIGKDLHRDMRKSVRRDFVARSWAKPSGGRVAWATTKPFGTKPAGDPLGGPGGRLARAWQGGAGGFSFARSDRVGIGVSLPFAAMHRGGTGTAAGFDVTIIKPKRKTASGQYAMFFFLGLKYGVWLRESTLARGLRVPSRPHGTDNPDLRGNLGGTLLDNLIEEAP